MPKRVDHEERRAQIAEALIRVAGRRGLHAVGMRDVAVEAGVSLRLVQYHFQTKEKLLLYGLRHLTGRFTARVGARLGAAGRDPGQCATVEALHLASLPTDEESRTCHLLHSSYSILSVTDDALAAQPSPTAPTPPRTPSPGCSGIPRTRGGQRLPGRHAHGTGALGRGRWTDRTARPDREGAHRRLR